jgi:hypothetical protein
MRRLRDRVITPRAGSAAVSFGSPADVGFLSRRAATRILRTGNAGRGGAHRYQRIVVVNA